MLTIYTPSYKCKKQPVQKSKINNSDNGKTSPCSAKKAGSRTSFYYSMTDNLDLLATAMVMLQHCL